MPALSSTTNPNRWISAESAGRRFGGWRHNQTALSLQRRLHLDGIPLVVLPITLGGRTPVTIECAVGSHMPIRSLIHGCRTLQQRSPAVSCTPESNGRAAALNG